MGSAGCEFSVLFTILYFFSRLVSSPLCFSVGLPLSVPTLLSPSHCCCQLIERTWLPSHHHLLPLRTPASHLQSRPVFLPLLNRPSPFDRCSSHPGETLSKHSLKSLLFSYLLPNTHLPFVSLSSVIITISISLSDRHLQSAGFPPRTPSLGTLLQPLLASSALQSQSLSLGSSATASPRSREYPSLVPLRGSPVAAPLSISALQFPYPSLSFASPFLASASPLPFFP